MDAGNVTYAFYIRIAAEDVQFQSHGTVPGEKAQLSSIHDSIFQIKVLNDRRQSDETPRSFNVLEPVCKVHPDLSCHVVFSGGLVAGGMEAQDDRAECTPRPPVAH